MLKKKPWSIPGVQREDKAVSGLVHQPSLSSQDSVTFVATEMTDERF
jgi:hypothetical protein